MEVLLLYILLFVKGNIYIIIRTDCTQYNTDENKAITENIFAMILNLLNLILFFLYTKFDYNCNVLK